MEFGFPGAFGVHLVCCSRARHKWRSALPGSTKRDHGSNHSICRCLHNENAMSRYWHFTLEHVGPLRHLSAITPTTDASPFTCVPHALAATPFRLRSLIYGDFHVSSWRHHMIAGSYRPCAERTLKALLSTARKSRRAFAPKSLFCYDQRLHLTFCDYQRLSV